MDQSKAQSMRELRDDLTRTVNYCAEMALEIHQLEQVHAWALADDPAQYDSGPFGDMTVLGQLSDYAQKLEQVADGLGSLTVQLANLEGVERGTEALRHDG